jgi:polyadenylation factor subunit 2
VSILTNITTTHAIPPAVTWHPVHPILVSGGSEGSILHWDIGHSDAASASTSASPPSPVQPRAILSQAHDSNVWSLAFHPLGHILVSASNDHTTRFWSRERPGDASSVFSGGGEKPPEVLDAGQDEEEETTMVPGFNANYAPDAWWGAGKEDEGAPTSRWAQQDTTLTFPSSTIDDIIPGIPGFGSDIGRQQLSGTPAPAQDDSYAWGRGAGDEWGQAGRQNRWGPRRKF